MYKLDRRRELEVASARIADQLGSSQRQHRAHALAAAGNQMACQFRDKRNFGLHTVQNHAVDLIHVAGDQ